MTIAESRLSRQPERRSLAHAAGLGRFTRADARGLASHVRDEAEGVWPDILAQIGVPADTLTKRNKPCPACGGRDRFSFLDKGYGAFVCRGMDSQGGDGFALVMHYLGCDFRTALRAVADALHITPAGWRTCPPPPRPKPPQSDAEHKQTPERRGILPLWESAGPIAPDQPAARYLVGRGLAIPGSPALRESHALPYWHERRELGRWPAMLAYVTGADGCFAGLHRTYLTWDGKKAAPTNTEGGVLTCKKLATVREGAMRGAAVRLFPPDGRLALAEGIETALAVAEHSRLPTWSTVSAFGLEHVALPDEVGDVWIFADNDRSGTGQRAGERLRRRLMAEGRRVRLLIPDLPGVDWLDVANTARGEA